MSRPLSLSAAMFYAGQRQAVSIARIREGIDLAATLVDPLRGDPDSPTVRHLVALLHRPRALVAEFFAGADRGRAEAAGGAT